MPVEVKSKKEDISKIESKKSQDKTAEDQVVSDIESDILEPEKKAAKIPSVADVVAKTLA